MKYNPVVVLAYFAEMGLPDCVREHQFHHERKWRFDFAWTYYRVALEVEGGVWIGGGHSRGSGVAKDIEKYNEAVRLGWRVVRCQPSQICRTEIITLIKDVIARTDYATEIPIPNHIRSGKVDAKSPSNR